MAISIRNGALSLRQAVKRPLFVVGSSGVEYALTAWWQRSGKIDEPQPLPSPGPVEQVIVMSGYAAPVTAAQIDWATRHGYAALRLDTVGLLNPETRAAIVDDSIRQALVALATGQSVILYAVHGPDDAAITATRAAAQSQGLGPAATGREVAQSQGQILRRLLIETGLRRVCVTGGDSSGHAARRLGIAALEVLVPITPGAPLCRAACDNVLDGLQIALKGGQNGGEDYFEAIRKGSVG